jgi:hypothetical protein
MTISAIRSISSPRVTLGRSPPLKSLLSPIAPLASTTSSSPEDTTAKSDDGDYLHWAPGRELTATGHYRSIQSTASGSVQDTLNLIQAAKNA